MIKQIFPLIISSGLLAGSVILTGCSNQPTVGDRMMTQGAGTAEIGEQWKAGNEKLLTGQKLIAQGNEMIEDARKDMRDGENKVIEGKKLIEEGKQKMEASEKSYKNRFPHTYQRIYTKPD